VPWLSVEERPTTLPDESLERALLRRRRAGQHREREQGEQDLDHAIRHALIRSSTTAPAASQQTPIQLGVGHLLWIGRLGRRLAAGHWLLASKCDG
jgi:hypothetical protein